MVKRWFGSVYWMFIGCILKQVLFWGSSNKNFCRGCFGPTYLDAFGDAMRLFLANKKTKGN